MEMVIGGKKVLWRGLRLACALALWASLAAAQDTVNYGSVSGRVTAPSGAVVPGAAVTIRQRETNVSTSSTTDEGGRFRFTFLRLGPYELTVRLDGFEDVTRQLTVSVGSAFELPIQLA